MSGHQVLTSLKDNGHKEKENKVSDYIDLWPKMVRSRPMHDICNCSEMKQIRYEFYGKKLGMSFFFETDQV